MDFIFEKIQLAIEAMRWVEVVAVGTGAVYVLLAARENVWCWAFGIVSTALWAYAAFVFFRLYLDGLLQIYYVVVGFYGWHEWLHGSKEDKPLKISTLSAKWHLKILIGGVVLTLLLGSFFRAYTTAAATYLDAFTTVFSLVATFLMSRKVLENWLYWIVIDGAYVYLYGSRGGYLFALLNVFFVIIAVFGYWKWLHGWKNESK